MFTLYLACFLIGGIFVGLSVLGGIDGTDFDHDFSLSHDLELGHNLETDIEINPYSEEEEESSFFTKHKRKFPRLPLTSLKFWTFGACFFGLTGLLLSLIQPPTLSPVAIMIISLVIGLFFGTAIVVILRNLQSNQANSMIHSEDLAGLEATVEIPFNSQTKGKVRVNVKGAIVDLIALTEDSKAFTKGEQVLIVGRENSKVWVVSISNQ